MMRFVRCLCLAVGLSIALACVPQEPYIILSENSLDVAEDGGSFVIGVDANVTFTPVSNQDWITINQAEGLQYEIIVEGNDSEEERSGEIFFISKAIKKSISVTQAAHSIIMLSEESVLTSNTGGLVAVSVRSNNQYKVEIDSDWISEGEITKATTSNIHYFTVLPNQEKTERSGSVVFFYPNSGVNASFVINQEAFYSLSVSQDLFEVPYEESRITIELDTNSEAIETVIDQGWIQNVDETTGTTKTFIIQGNIQTVQRAALIIFKDDAKGLFSQVVVKQAAADFLDLPSQLDPVSSSGGQVELSVSSNASMEVMTDVDWISFLNISLADGRVVIMVAPNPSFKERIATVFFRAVIGSLEGRLSLVQQGKIPSLSFDQNGSFACAPLLPDGEDRAVVYWGDGVSERYTPNATHTYSDNLASHTITIRPLGSRSCVFKDIINVEQIDISSL